MFERQDGAQAVAAVATAMVLLGGRQR